MRLSELRIAVFAILMVFFQGCGGDGPEPAPPQKTPEQLAVEALTGSGSLTWVIAGGGSVTRSGTNVTELYQTFELQINSGTTKTYTSINNNDLFDASGNWSFAGTNFDKFILTGSKPAAGREISFTRTGDNLRLEFNIPAPGGRINGVFAVAGSYVFNLVKK
ncbi:hypothetical protein [Algoriphagus sp. CAU 1675]|uniref:hypothetical protein n=1 Tax=Algoriphagus sp. CAU 1675 TaxID=3032597 RepID=UPI0023DA6318|nr:hypothetical protein [Algoriphagus sp. CAU 1675]MDF2158622.1 hypothetical protein [Algoriphagus sp. CAU 1675]